MYSIMPSNILTIIITFCNLSPMQIVCVAPHRDVSYTTCLILKRLQNCMATVILLIVQWATSHSLLGGDLKTTCYSLRSSYECYTAPFKSNQLQERKREEKQEGVGIQMHLLVRFLMCIPFGNCLCLGIVSKNA